MEQRSLFRECVYAAELGRKHLDELANVVRHSRPEAGKVSQHLTEVRGAVTEMLEDHHRFILDLTEEQWMLPRGPLQSSSSYVQPSTHSSRVSMLN
jgi:hypothetical protein